MTPQRLIKYQNAAPYLLLAVVSLIFHLPALTAGLIAVEDDTRVFYFPLLVVTARALSELTLPLWTPGIFAGYPLFADGEAGMLYPLHYLVLPWLAPEASLVVLRVVHSFLASAFMYLLLRTLGMGMVAGVVGGITFGYSGFAAGQIIHDNVFHAMVWLPLGLALKYLVKNQGKLEAGVYPVPREMDAEVGRLKLQSMGIHIDILTPAQKRYQESWEEGT